MQTLSHSHVGQTDVVFLRKLGGFVQVGEVPPWKTAGVLPEFFLL